jgi:hypothetical protein
VLLYSSVIHHGVSIARARDLKERDRLAGGMSASFERSAPTPA